MSSERAVVLSVDDIGEDDIDAILGAAHRHIEDTSASNLLAGRVVGLLFLSPSLRTRAGYAVAAARLGAAAVDVFEARGGGGMSMPESFADTLRTVDGMVDVVVLRVPFRLDRFQVTNASKGPVISGGDMGGEHPTQALVDLFAIETQRGPVDELRVCICGDLGSRTARSLVKLLGRRLPRELMLVGPPGRDPGVQLGAALAARTERRHDLDVTDVDVLYLPGLPEGEGATRLTPAERAGYAVTTARLEKLPADAVVLAPMPVIDEISNDARNDPRVRIHEQSDSGVAVRMAVLVWALDRTS